MASSFCFSQGAFKVPTQKLMFVNFGARVGSPIDPIRGLARDSERRMSAVYETYQKLGLHSNPTGVGDPKKGETQNCVFPPFSAPRAEGKKCTCQDVLPRNYRGRPALQMCKILCRCVAPFSQGGPPKMENKYLVVA